MVCVYPEHQSRKRKDKSAKEETRVHFDAAPNEYDWRGKEDVFLPISGPSNTYPPPTPNNDLLSQWHFSPQNSANMNGDMALEQLFGSDPFFDLSFLGGEPVQANAGDEIDWDALGLGVEQTNNAVNESAPQKKAMRFRVPYFR
jgi:hypothetical protein